MAGKRPAKRTIVFKGARKEYPDGTVAVDSLDLSVTKGEVLCLVGPSGCGKSTTLRMVNRLVEPSAGSITVNGEDVMAQDAVQLRRHIGYVIQHVGLFPHRTVSQNVATVPGLVGWDKARTAARVAELLELVGLPEDTYGARYPHELSGGERQRVGVARALATEPPVLLMDEPFGAVDPQGRSRLQQEFSMIQRKLGLTVMMVTHDIREAAVLADRIVVFSDGATVEQIGAPDDVLGKPANAFVSDFVADFDVPALVRRLWSPRAPFSWSWRRRRRRPVLPQPRRPSARSGRVACPSASRATARTCGAQRGPPLVAPPCVVVAFSHSLPPSRRLTLSTHLTISYHLPTLSNCDLHL